MKINLNALTRYKAKILEEDMTFSESLMSVVDSIKSVEFCNVKATVEDLDDIIRIGVEVKADVVLTCAYTLEPINYHLETEDFFDFTTNDAYEADEEIFYVENPEVELEPYILGLLITEVPTKITKEGATLPSGGKGYEVITEETYEKRKVERVDPRFAKLDDIEFDN